MSFVVDNSVALTWCFEAERTDATEAMLHQVQEFGAVVPELWPLEAVNGLLMAQRRGRLNNERRLQLLKFLKNLPIAVDCGAYEHAWTLIADLAERYHLTAYDAAYLELALRRELPLATLDKDLQRAGKKLRLEIWGA